MEWRRTPGLKRGDMASRGEGGSDCQAEKAGEREEGTEEDDVQVISLEEFMRGVERAATADEHANEEGEEESGQDRLYEPDTDIGEHEELDPRVQTQLEELNSSMQLVNECERELASARSELKRLRTEWNTYTSRMLRRHRGAIKAATPYFHQQSVADDLKAKMVECNSEYKAAKEAHDAARHELSLLENGFRRADAGNTEEIEATIEELSNASDAVTNAENRKRAAYDRHERCAELASKAQAEVERLRKHNRNAIEKARPFFDAKTQAEREVQQQSKHVDALKQQLSNEKERYNAAMRALEQISAEVHEQREARRQKEGEHDHHNEDRQPHEAIYRHANEQRHSLSFDQNEETFPTTDAWLPESNGEEIEKNQQFSPGDGRERQRKDDLAAQQVAMPTSADAAFADVDDSSFHAQELSFDLPKYHKQPPSSSTTTVQYASADDLFDGEQVVQLHADREHTFVSPEDNGDAYVGAE